MAREFSKHLTIRVSNLPDEATESHVKIYFQRKKNGGGEVTEVRMIPNSHEALVMFEEEEGKIPILDSFTLLGIISFRLGCIIETEHSIFAESV